VFGVENIVADASNNLRRAWLMCMQHALLSPRPGHMD